MSYDPSYDIFMAGVEDHSEFIDWSTYDCNSDPENKSNKRNKCNKRKTVSKEINNDSKYS